MRISRDRVGQVTRATETLTLICTRTCSTCRKAVALLERAGASFVYREYTSDPLDEDEIRDVLGRPAEELLSLLV